MVGERGIDYAVPLEDIVRTFDFTLSELRSH